MARHCCNLNCCNCLTSLAICLFLSLEAGGLNTFADFHFIAEPVDTVVVKGNPAILNCSATGDPPPSVKWKREGSNLLLSDHRRRILENGSLYFEKVHHTRTERPDEGLYQCSVNQIGIGTIISRPAKLQIASLPKFDVHPGDLTLFPQQTAYFPCSVLAIPPATIKWLKNEHPLHLDNSRMTVLPSGALEIDLVEKTDSASYRCNASNIEKFRLSDAGILTVNHNFDAANLIASPYFVATPLKTSVVVEGNQMTLDCVANGNPKPKITWLKDGTTIDMAHLDSRFRIVGSGSLHIEKIREDDAGTYMCRAENNEDSVDSLASVVVHVPPRFIRKPQNKYAFEKEDIEFECEVYGQPLPTIQWYRDGSHLIQSEYYQYIKGYNLRILGVVKSDAGVYQCIASNPAGSLQASLQLIIHDLVSTSLTTTYASATTAHLHETLGTFNNKDAPSAPQNLTAIIAATRFVTLKWSPPIRSNGNIFAYSVYYREMSSPRERVLNTTRVRLEEINVQGLQPSTTYVFRIVAYNQHGPGESSENLTVMTQNEVKVPSLPLKLEAFPLNATSILVRWHPPGEGSGPIHQYVVYFMEDGSLEEQKTSTTDTFQVLSTLKKFTEYTIWVTATNHLGVGQSTKEVVVRTYADVPSDTPQNVTLEPASSSSIIVRWEPPPKEAQNGVITGYKIRYKMNNRRAETVTTDGNRRLYALTGLGRGITYNVKIAALSVNGSGPFTEWLTADTYQNDLNESRVPDQPSSLRARPSATSILVNWTPPRNMNIMIRGYTIGWGIGFPDVYKQVLDGKQRHYNIENLSPSSEYVISLRAINQVGDGRPVYETVKTLAETTPEPLSAMMPPVGLKAIVLSATTVVLYWTDTSLFHNQIVTDSRYYTVRYSTTNKHKYFNSTDLNCMINDLKPNTQYEFSVKVVKGRRESTWSMSVLNTTHEAVPSSPPRDLTIVPSEDDSSQVNLHWQPPKQPNGHIIGYVISYSTVPPQRNLAVEDRKWALEESIGDKMATILKGLALDTVYYFKIQAKNSKGYGPFSSEISFRTSVESKSLSNSMMYVIIACVSGGTLIILIVVIIVVCRKRQRFLHSKRNSYAKGTLTKNKSLGKELVPPDLWIHHDQMELKPVDKTVCAENNMTVTPIQRNSQELEEEPLLSCVEKKKSAYLDTHEDNSIDKCVVKCHIRATPIKIPLDVQKPLINHTSAVPLPSGSTSQVSDAGGSTLSRPMYPRTQYNIPRTHNSGEICHAADVIVPMPLNTHTTPHGASYEPVISSISVEKCQGYPTTSAVCSAIEHSSGTLTKRLPGHPLRSFTVPAPPPQSAPATPQPKHLDTCVPKPTGHHSGVESSSSVVHQALNTVQPAVKVQSEGGVGSKATSGAQVHISWSTEKLNQEVANLEGLMKDLNAIRASEFEC